MKFDAFRDRIYPWIKVIVDSPNPMNELELDKANSPIMQPWLGNLIVMYAIDTGDHFEMLQHREIPDGLTIADINALALENLARNVKFQFAQTGFGGHGLIAGGDHETGALVWPGIWEWCAAQINDNLVVAAPAKDLLMMVPASDPIKIAALEQMVANIFETGNRLLTRQLFHYDRATQQWRLWTGSGAA